MFPTTLPVLQDGLLPLFDLLFPLLIVCQGVMGQGRSCIASATKKPGVPPAEGGGFGEYAAGSGCKAHPAMGERLDLVQGCRGAGGLGRGSLFMCWQGCGRRERVGQGSPGNIQAWR